MERDPSDERSRCVSGRRGEPAPGFIAYLLQKYGLDRFAQ